MAYLISSLDHCIELLKSGEPVALPTETVYGLSAPIHNPKALEKIFNLKKRPFSDPLIVHVSSLDMAKELFEEPSPHLDLLAKHFWPGPLTVVDRKNKNLVSDLITAGKDTVAVRIPKSDVFLKIIDQLGSPLAAPSANLFKKVSPTCPKHVLKTFPQVFVFNSLPSSIGIESTILDINQLEILRPGFITHEDIEKIINKKVTYRESVHSIPGSEKDHYQPNLPLWVYESKEELQNHPHTYVEVKLPLSPHKAGAQLYDQIRQFDSQKHETMVIVFSPKLQQDPKWFGVENRLKKAATRWINNHEDS